MDKELTCPKCNSDRLVYNHTKTTAYGTMDLFEDFAYCPETYLIFDCQQCDYEASVLVRGVAVQ